MTSPAPETTLEDIRRDIDAIDDAMLGLLIRRLEATARVRSRKHSDGSLTASPFRPAREAQMLRRLVAGGHGRIDPQLVVRLWRVILSSSIQEQAAVTLHVDHGIARNIEMRVELAQHFCGFDIAPHDNLSDTLAMLSVKRGDLAVVKTESAWADVITGDASVIGTLPVLKDGRMPRLLIIGNVEPVPSGSDETILLSAAPLPADHGMAQQWQSRSGSWHVTCCKGFGADTLHLQSVEPSLKLRVAGRFPASIEASP